MMKSINILIAIIFLTPLLSIASESGCECSDSKISIEQDINHSEIIAIVQLEEGKVEGNWGIRKKNAEIKKEVVLTKRRYTRYDLQLRGKLIKKLKGEPQLIQEKDRGIINDNGEVVSLNIGPEIVFNILMKNIGVCRNGVVFDGEQGDDLPDLIVGHQYVVLIEKKEYNHIYYKNIWPIDSEEAKKIIEQTGN